MRQNHIGGLSGPWLLVGLAGAVVACSLAAGGPSANEPPATTSVSPGPPGGAAAAQVSVSVDRDRYQAGEPIMVTIVNRQGVALYAPPPGRCAVVSVWRLDAGKWVSVDSCPSFSVNVTEIPATSDLTQELGHAGQPPAATGPIVHDPVAPTVGSDDLTNLPTTAPPKSGDPVRIVPEGAIAPPFSSAPTDLGSGTFRIEFSFAPGSVFEQPLTVYSERFVVTD